MDEIKAKRGGKYDRQHVEGYADMRESDYNNPRYLEEVGAIPVGSKQFMDEKQAQDAAVLRKQALQKMLEMSGQVGKPGEPEIQRGPASEPDMEETSPEEDEIKYQKLMKLLGR